MSTFSNSSIHVGIIGAAGYTAGELIRILLFHPQVSLRFVHSQSQCGKAVHSVHQDLLGETDLIFTQEIEEVDVLFFCSGHGKTLPFLKEHPVSDSVKIIDLSSDFRLIQADHDFLYGLPELHRQAIRSARHIANPGCFATAIQLALLPLAQAHLLHQPLHIHAITGSTGAGQKPVDTTHFSWRNNNISIYKPFRHQHLGEIHQSLKQLQQNATDEINFLPLRGDFTRGIFASIYTQLPIEEPEVRQLYETYYQDHPFVWISEKNPSLKMVVNTNKCMLHIQKHGDKLLIISMIDNLIKGASGQAVQNMNLMFGLEETIGLSLKAMAF